MSKDRDRQAKVAPPRESDAARFQRFLTQTGLRSGPHCAKQRRALERKGTPHGRLQRGRR